MEWNAATTWIGYVGAGVTATLVGGVSFFQFELRNLGDSLPGRVYVTSKRVGLMAHAGVSHAMVLVTGCKSISDMEGITSSGIDWAFDIGASPKALTDIAEYKKYKELFIAVEHLALTGKKWAIHEASKRLVQAVMNDLGVIQSGKQFNVLPSPFAMGLGVGVAYDWQTMHVMGGKQAWSIISPTWHVENSHDGLRLQLDNIPEQDGTQIILAIGVDEWGIDPLICWKTGAGGSHVDNQQTYHIYGYVFDRKLYASADSEKSGILLGKLKPIGRFQAGWTSTAINSSVKKSGTMKVYPLVISFGNYPYWSAGDSVEVEISNEGRFMSSEDAGSTKH